MKEWFRIAWSASVRRRARRVAGVVGAALLAINHGDAILRGDFSPARLLRMGLTLIVPYLVSTFSSVGAIRELRRTGEGAPGPGPGRDLEALDRLAS
ncbi:MAG TPA: nitrate/nitrite transporter NrtS [Thermoanaerobaculia bacterium]|jgi:hypothetical protein